MKNLSDKYLLMIHVKKKYSETKPTKYNRYVRRLSRLLRSSTEGKHYKGFFTCCCGKRSDNCDIILKGGVITNSLAMHYLLHHYDEVPKTELEKISKLSKK